MAPGVTVQLPTIARLAASLRTGQWQMVPSGGVVPSPYVQLLAYEWTARPGRDATVRIGYPVAARRQGASACGIAASLGTQQLFRARYGDPETYLTYPFLDNPGELELLGYGVGVVLIAQNNRVVLTYYRRTSSAGTITCGTREPFDLLLSAPGRAAVAGMRLYPNPATTTATLELPAPTAAPAHLTLLNSTGQTIRTQLLPIAAIRAKVMLAGLPAGLYLMRLEQPGSLPLLLRLQRN